ncbi:hypothetical protein [Natronobacterium gregoryi]|uniref:Acetate/CoA ligase n=2 Tax=Natronobacterium gregoryi TaxID=44930 RepID=L9Y7S2_NATGS|nr:acetate/CoA ligase [Natronobacterium gregoryi SP2]SFJ62275.1 acetyl-CoA synthetase [Natronobacterium gregoryi]
MVENGFTSPSETRRPPSAFGRDTTVTDPDLHERFDREWADCWAETADLLEWDEPDDTLLEDDDAPFCSDTARVPRGLTSRYFIGGSSAGD